MDIFDQHYRWHPRFKVIEHTAEQCVLLSEKEQYLFNLKNFSLLNNILSESNVDENWLDKIDAENILAFTHSINQLKRAGYIVKAESPVFSQYLLPSFTADSINICNTRNHVDITNLSSFDNLNRLLEFVDPLKIVGRYHIVVVDDYLDPRLAELNQRFREKLTPWLIIKLTGEAPAVGPLFLHHQKEAPCWHCFKDRVEKNQSIRAWQTRILQTPIALPIKIDKTTIASSTFKIAQLANKLIEQQDCNSIYELDFETGKSRLHPVTHRPQCRSCGDPEYFSKQVFSPIELTTAAIVFSKDGGVRTKSPEETNNALAHLVSPLSGVSSHLSSVSPKEQGINKIFRSTFYKTPYHEGNLNAAHFAHTTMGKGITAEQSKASALCETIERLASNYQGDEPAIFGKAGQDRIRYITPKELTPYSEAQYLEFSDFQKSPQSMLYGVEEYRSQTSLYWTPVWSLSNQEHCYVPFDFCYDSTPFQENYSRFFTNGGAAGNTLEEAILQGLLEVVERDAVAIWWYNKIPRPAVTLENVSDELMVQLKKTLGQDWDYWVLDLTHDFEIPVYAAISQHKTSGEFSFGFGCHLEARIACQRALTELCQITEIRGNNTSPFEFDKINSSEFLFPAQDQPSVTLNDAEKTSSDIKFDIDWCVQQASKLELEVLALNYTRPDLQLFTAKVIIPGCCHIFPYLGAERLYQTPVKLGWLSSPRRENELNNHALLI